MAHHRHKREADARRFASLTGTRAVRIAAGAAVAATIPAVALGVVAAHPTSPTALTAREVPSASLGQGGQGGQAGRGPTVSRSTDRTADRSAPGPARSVSPQKIAARADAEAASAAATATALKKAHVHRWTTTDLNLWSDSVDSARLVGLIQSSKQVLVTGRAAHGRVELDVGGASRWVTAGYLADHKPSATSTAAGAAAGVSMAPCPDTSVEYRLTSAAIYVYRSVCHAFPQITTYGGWDDHGEHVSGRALDIMTSDVSLGNAIAAFLQAHAAELHLYDILWQQRIWTPVRASEGWRLFADRGSPTGNHMDHVHVSVS